jgi:hydroxymethylpyrimidine pyrophosphatase-like HAD family hydrolase
MVMGYRLLAMDVDGTVLGPDRGLSRRTVAALARARREGLDYTLVTGRQWAEAKVVVRALDVRLPVICQNGAHVLDPATGKDWLHERIDTAAAMAVAGALREAGVVYYTYVDQDLFVERPLANRLLWGHQWPPRGVPGWMAWFRWIFQSRRDMRILPVGRMEEALAARGVGPTGMTAWDGAPEVIAALPPAVRAQVDLVQNNAHSWNVVPAGTSKQHGLAWLAEHMAIPAEAVVAVGDSYNDLPMIRWAGLGVAMGNAPLPVKAEAKYVTGSNRDDGVAQLVERLLGRAA